MPLGVPRLTAQAVVWLDGCHRVVFHHSCRMAQAIDLTGRTVSSVVIDGLQEIDPQLVLNQIRLVQGQAYDPNVVRDDVVRSHSHRPVRKC